MIFSLKFKQEPTKTFHLESSKLDPERNHNSLKFKLTSHETRTY